MLLLFDPEPPITHWCAALESGVREYKCEFIPDWTVKVRETIGDTGDLKGVGVILDQGGGEFPNGITPVTPETFEKIDATKRLLHERNEWSSIIARRLFETFPDIPQYILCESAFFTAMPDEAAFYAIPYTLTKSGIRRYGGSGLCHQWVWDRCVELLPAPPRKLISVQLGDNPNIAAIMDGRPLETTTGFTPVEGIPSRHATGDIDPTIVFHLRSAGMSFKEINKLLTHESGFTGLTGKGCSYSKLIQNKDAQPYSFTYGVLKYHIIKYIGAFISILGGVDAIAFAGEFIEESRAFIKELCQEMKFIGLRTSQEITEKNGACILTDKNSLAQVIGLKYVRYHVLIEQMRDFSKETGGRKK